MSTGTVTFAESSFLVHDTGVRELFELRSKGTPRGTAWFWKRGFEDKGGMFTWFYRKDADRGLRRRLTYHSTRNLTLHDLSTTSKRESFLEEIATARKDGGLTPLPVVLSGRASLLDRWGSYIGDYSVKDREKYPSAFIQGHLVDLGVDGVIEENNVIALFRPEECLRLHDYICLENGIYEELLELLQVYRDSRSSTLREFTVVTKRLFEQTPGKKWKWLTMWWTRLPPPIMWGQFSPPSEMFAGAMLPVSLKRDFEAGDDSDEESVLIQIQECRL